jgi:O-methyltransferase involved in polyketide biosynthesis
MYLSLDAVEQTLATLGGLAAGSRLVITYDLPPSALAGTQLGVRDVLASLVSELGEPFLTMFEPDQAELLLRRMGFDNIVHFGPADAVRVYFGGRGGFEVGGAQRLLAATLAAARA